MIDELLCMHIKEGKKVFSVTKLLVRITFFIVGVGSSMLVSYLTQRGK